MEPQRLKQLKRHDSLDADLLTIYRDRQGQLPDITRFKVHRTSWPRRLVLWLILAAAVAFGGWWMFATVRGLSSPPDPGRGLNVTVEAPPQMAAGEEVTYAVRYRNDQTVALQAVEVTLRYPEGFTFLRATPQPSNQYRNAWQLGRLPAGAAGTIQVTGKIIGPVGAIITLSGTANFQPANFSSPFKQNFSQSSQITSSLMTLTVSGTPQTIVGGTATYTVALLSTGDQDLTGLLVELDYPETFIFERATPAPSAPPTAPGGDSRRLEPNTTWYLARLPPQQAREIAVRGHFGEPAVGSNGREQTLVARVGVVDELGTVSAHQEERFTTTLLQPNLQLNLIVNGEPTDQPVNFGETLSYRIVYKNLGQDPLEEVSIAIAITSELVDWETLQDGNLGQRDGTTLRWGREEIAQLSRLEPLDEGVIDFSLQLKPASAVSATVLNYATVSTLRATGGAIGGIPASVEISLPPLNHTVNTSLELKVEGRYFNDDNLAVGSGPLPPVVGQKTSFRIYWSLANNLHPVERVTVSTKLSSGVQWEDKFLASTGHLVYRPEDQTVTWTVVKVPAQQSHEDTNAWFDISVLPKPDQVGKLLLLTSETNLTATDTETNSTIVDLRRSITSNLEDDPFGGGRGLVVEVGE